MTTKTTIKICERHGERPTPLIYTFRFPGAEYWCPHCDVKVGMFDFFGLDVPVTPELIATGDEDKARVLHILTGEE